MVWLTKAEKCKSVIEIAYHRIKLTSCVSRNTEPGTSVRAGRVAVVARRLHLPDKCALAQQVDRARSELQLVQVVRPRGISVGDLRLLDLAGGLGQNDTDGDLVLAQGDEPGPTGLV